MRRYLLVLLALGVLLLAAAAPVSAAPVTRAKDMVKPTARVPARGAPEIATPPYKGYTYYSDLRRIIRRIEARSHGRVDVNFSGKSANGNSLWTVVVTDPMSFKDACANERFRSLLLTDPAKAAAMLTPRSGIRIPVFINCSIHGGETTGMDAGLRLLRRLAFKDDHETRRILDEAVVIINPCQNPDGRITDSRSNGNGFDCNRDFITLTQPEDVITTNTMRAWLPTTMLDLHGYVDPMLIEPTTIPHNPNLEYDLIIGSALPLGRAMKAALEDATGHTGQIPYLWGTAEDYDTNANEGWDDYGPYYTPQLAQEYGAAAFTLETSSKTTDGVDGHYAVSLEAVKYSVDNKWQMLKNQTEFFRRGIESVPDSVTGRPWAGNMTDMIRAAIWNPVTQSSVIQNIAWGQPGFPYSNVVGDVTFPYAYVIPVDPSLQRNPLEAYKALNHALAYDVKVEVAKAPFSAGGTTYPAGTYVIRMQQALRSLANNLLWDGEDVKAKYGVSSMYDISAWSTPYIWGYTRAKIDAPFSAWLKTVKPAEPARVVGNPPAADYTARVVGKTGVVTGAGPVFWWKGDNLWAVLVANQMMLRHYPVGMVTRQIAPPYDGIPVGAFVVDTTNLPWAVKFVANRAAGYGIDFTTAAGLQLAQVSTLSTPNVQVAVDANTVFVLKQQMGFANVTSWVSSNASIPNSATTVISSSSSSPSLSMIQTWLNGATSTNTHTYFGVTRNGVNQTMATGLLPGVTVGNDPASADNGVVKVDYTQDDLLTATYPAHDYAFAYPPYWFSTIPAGVSVDATYTQGIAGPFQQGFWNNANQAAVGSAAMISGSYGTGSAPGRVIFTGFHPTYRGFQDNTALLVGRAVLLSNATPPSMP
jgi:Zinc carboxypeptidase